MVVNNVFEARHLQSSYRLLCRQTKFFRLGCDCLFMTLHLAWLSNQPDEVVRYSCGLMTHC